MFSILPFIFAIVVPMYAHPHYMQGYSNMVVQQRPFGTMIPGNPMISQMLLGSPMPPRRMPSDYQEPMSNYLFRQQILSLIMSVYTRLIAYAQLFAMLDKNTQNNSYNDSVGNNMSPTPYNPQLPADSQQNYQNQMLLQQQQQQQQMQLQQQQTESEQDLNEEQLLQQEGSIQEEEEEYTQEEEENTQEEEKNIQQEIEKQKKKNKNQKIEKQQEQNKKLEMEKLKAQNKKHEMGKQNKQNKAQIVAEEEEAEEEEAEEEDDDELEDVQEELGKLKSGQQNLKSESEIESSKTPIMELKKLKEIQSKIQQKEKESRAPKGSIKSQLPRDQKTRQSSGNNKRATPKITETDTADPYAEKKVNQLKGGKIKNF